MYVIIIGGEAPPDSLFEQETETRLAEKIEQSCRALFVILPDRRGRKAKSVFEKNRRIGHEPGGAKIVTLVGYQQLRSIMFGNLRCKLGRTEGIVRHHECFGRT